MNNFYCICVMLVTLLANAQVGIGTTNSHPSALLEISSNNSGVLIPRMTLTQRNNINIPEAGLLIYQTDNNEGFYYYNCNLSIWKALNEYELPQGSNPGDMTYWNGVNWTLIPATINEGATLQIMRVFQLGLEGHHLSLVLVILLKVVYFI